MDGKEIEIMIKNLEEKKPDNIYNRETFVNHDVINVLQTEEKEESEYNYSNMPDLSYKTKLQKCFALNNSNKR